jgi:hypothetical protein
VNLVKAAEKLIPQLPAEERFHASTSGNLAVHFELNKHIEMIGMKPAIGLWYGFGAEWLEWCVGNIRRHRNKPAPMAKQPRSHLVLRLGRGQRLRVAAGERRGRTAFRILA